MMPPIGLQISRELICKSCCAVLHCGGANAASISMEDDMKEALRDLARELGMTRNDTISFIVRERVETNTYLPARMSDQETEVDGHA